MKILCYISCFALYISTGVLAEITTIRSKDVAPFFAVIRCNNVNVGNGAIVANNLVLTSKFVVTNKEECKVIFDMIQFTNYQISSDNTKAISEIIQEDRDPEFAECFVLLKVDTPFVHSVNLVPNATININIGRLFHRHNMPSHQHPSLTQEVLVSQEIRIINKYLNDFKYAIPKLHEEEKLLLAGSPLIIDNKLCKMVIASLYPNQDDFDFLIDIRPKLKWINAKISATNI